VSGGYSVYRGLLGNDINWEDMNIAGVRIAALGYDAVILVNEWGELYSLRV
jgi:hypothetical protein